MALVAGGLSVYRDSLHDVVVAFVATLVMLLLAQQSKILVKRKREKAYKTWKRKEPPCKKFQKYKKICAHRNAYNISLHT